MEKTKKSINEMRKEHLKRVTNERDSIWMVADKDYQKGDEIDLGTVEAENHKLLENVISSITNMPIRISPATQIRKSQEELTQQRKAKELKNIRKQKNEKAKTKKIER